MSEWQKRHIHGYFKRKEDLVRGIDFQQIINLYTKLKSVSESGSRVFIAGNGGSASTAEHFVTDLGVGSHIRGISNSIKAVSLSSNSAVLTALSNDTGFEHVFAKQLELFKPVSTDLVVGITASGNSPNILNLLKSAKVLGVPSFVLTGFDGGGAREMADFSIHISSSHGEYGVVEDLHMSICHVVTELLRK